MFLGGGPCTRRAHVASTFAAVAPLRYYGLSMAGYIPDSSLLVVGTHAAAEEMEAWPGVVWVVSVQRGVG
jgi:hypothetical protein